LIFPKRIFGKPTHSAKRIAQSTKLRLFNIFLN
jgi:hypothetical protein